MDCRWWIVAVALVGAATAGGCKKKAPENVGTAAPVVIDQRANTTPEFVQSLRDNFQRVYFDVDSSDLNADTKAMLDANVGILQTHPDVKIQVQGHADERGTIEYNLALGNRRAEAVCGYLEGAGIASSRLTVISFGEEKPAVVGSYESAWSKNRRAEFVITWGNNVTGSAPQ